jgi:hypothetical protein
MKVYCVGQKCLHSSKDGKWGQRLPRITVRIESETSHRKVTVGRGKRDMHIIHHLLLTKHFSKCFYI